MLIFITEATFLGHCDVSSAAGDCSETTFIVALLFRT